MALLDVEHKQDILKTNVPAQYTMRSLLMLYFAIAGYVSQLIKHAPAIFPASAKVVIKQ